MTSYMLYDYNKIEGGDYSPFYDTLNHSNAMKYWNLGNSQVTFAAHGYSDGDALLHYIGDGDMAYKPPNILPFFDHEDAANCKNGGMLPLVYGSACGVGNFTEPDDSNMEKLMYAQSGGAIGVIMASSKSTYRCEFEENDSSYGNWWLLDEFWRLFYEEDHYQPGKALYESKANYGNRIIDPLNPHKEYPYKTLYKTNRAAYNLLGDPEVPIWTDVPQELIVEYPKPLYINNNSLTVTIKSPDGQPVKNALVCLITDDLYMPGRTEANGSLTFTLDLSETTTINMTVTAHNFFRWTGKVDVVAVIDVKYDKNSYGHSVEYPKEDDPITVFVNITNMGEVPVNDLTIEFFQNTMDAENMVKRFSAQSLAAKESRLYLFTWEVLPGTTKMYVFADPDNKYFEYNEENNLGYIEIQANIPAMFLSPPDMLMYEDTQLIDNLSATENMFIYAKDSDGPEPLAFSILNTSEPECNCSLVKLADDDIRLNVIPPPDWFGSLQVVIQCSDGPTTATTDITVNVKNVPDPPEFTQADMTYVNESEIFYWSASVLDIDSLSLNFTCSSETLDIGWGQADTKKVYFTFVANNSLVGDHIVTILAQDESDLSAEMEITVRVLNVNTPPIIVEPAKDSEYDLEVNEEFLLYVKARDEDKGDTLTFIDDSYLFEINESSGAIRFTPKSRDVGTHSVTVWVLDENGTQDKLNITFIVTEDRFEGDSYTILIIFIASIVLIVTLSLAFQAWRKDKQHDGGSTTYADDEGAQIKREPVSIQEWASKDKHVEDLVEEYSKNDLKRLKQPTMRSLTKGEQVPKLPPAKLKRKVKKERK